MVLRLNVLSDQIPGAVRVVHANSADKTENSRQKSKKRVGLRSVTDAHTAGLSDVQRREGGELWKMKEGRIQRLARLDHLPENEVKTR